MKPQSIGIELQAFNSLFVRFYGKTRYGYCYYDPLAVLSILSS